MNNDDKAKSVLEQHTNKQIDKKINEIISLKERFDKRFGLYKENIYQVEIKTKTEEVKSAEDNTNKHGNEKNHE